MKRSTKAAGQKRTAGQKIMIAAQILMVIVNLAIWGTVGWREYKEATREPQIGIDYYPMANQNIEWYWAGKPMD